MFVTLSIISTFLILMGGLAKKENKALGMLTVLVILGQIISAFAEFGFLAGAGALFLATLVEGGVASFMTKRT